MCVPHLPLGLQSILRIEPLPPPFFSAESLTYLSPHRPRDRNTSPNRWCPPILARLPIRGQVTRVHAADAPQEAIPFQIGPGSPRLRAAGFSGLVQFKIGLGLDQIVLVL